MDYINKLLSELSPREVALADLLINTALELRQMRLDLGYSQEEAASKCEISQAMISKYESGEYNPSLKTLFEYILTLGGHLSIEISAGNNTHNEGLTLTNRSVVRRSSNSYMSEKKEPSFAYRQNDGLYSEQYSKWSKIA